MMPLPNLPRHLDFSIPSTARPPIIHHMFPVFSGIFGDRVMQ